MILALHSFVDEGLRVPIAPQVARAENSGPK